MNDINHSVIPRDEETKDLCPYQFFVVRLGGLLRIITLIILAIAPLRAEFQKVRTASGETIEALPGHVLVKFKPGHVTSLRVRKTIPSIGVSYVPVPAGQTVQRFLNQLNNNPNVEFAEPDGVIRALTSPNDPGYGSQYALNSSHINIEPAWDITQGDPSIVIAVVDTGITLTHQDLDGNLWVNPSPSGHSGLNGTRIEIDWNGDGDCIDTFVEVGPEQCASNDPTDDNTGEFHGTRVSGIIAAETDNNLDIAGIARNCRLMGVKALNSVGAGSFGGIAEGITYAANHGASVINLSLGGRSSDSSGAVQLAINYAINNKNAVVVAASGNDGNSFGVTFPASMDNVIAVGATTPSNGLATFSCTGHQLDLVAPGESILSTYAPNTTASDDGTSFSAPMVSGVVALMRSLKPNLSVAEVTNIINFTATDLGPSGFDNNFGFGLLNAYQAVLAVSNGTVFITNPADREKTFPYPNPLRLGTGSSVQFSIPNNPAATSTNGIEITVYNSAGQEVKRLSNTITWDGRNDSGHLVASGIYFYHVKSPGGEFTGKLTVIK